MNRDQITFARCLAEVEHCAVQPGTSIHGSPESRTYHRVSRVFSKLHDALHREPHGYLHACEVYDWVESRGYSHVRTGQPVTFPTPA